VRIFWPISLLIVLLAVADEPPADGAKDLSTAGTLTPRPTVSPLVERPLLLEPRLVLEGLGQHAVASFQPAVAGVDAWNLTVRESAGPIVAVISGEGSPPEAILWDGRLLDETWARPGMRYAYTFSFQYPGGSSKTVTGEEFQLTSYVREEPEGVTVLFTAPAKADAPATDSAVMVGPQVRRTAALLNRNAYAAAPVTIEVLAREEDRARIYGEAVRSFLVAELTPPHREINLYVGHATAAPAAGTAMITTRRVP
jgi:hypothetical protein